MKTTMSKPTLNKSVIFNMNFQNIKNPRNNRNKYNNPKKITKYLKSEATPIQNTRYEKALEKEFHSLILKASNAYVFNKQSDDYTNQIVKLF